MAVQYVKYRVLFKSVTEKLYNVEIYGSVPDIQSVPKTIQLTPGESPLEIDEDNSEDFFAPIRTQTGNLTICTKIEPQFGMPEGGILDLLDIVPRNNSDSPVMIKCWNESMQEYEIIWCGYLSCESYSQSYTETPENIEITINSVLEAWKSVYYGGNAKIVKVSDLLDEIIHDTYFFQFLVLHKPLDCANFWDLYINTTNFIEKIEYQDEESVLYKLKGKSYYYILETICKFLGCTAREHGFSIYIQKAQGYGLLENTETREMSLLQWRGTNHQRSIVTGAKTIKVTSKLEEMSIDVKLPMLPIVDMLQSRDNQISSDMTPEVVHGGYFVYTWPSLNTKTISNIVMYNYEGRIRLGYNPGGGDTPYDFVHIGDSNTSTVINYSIPYDNNLYYNPIVRAQDTPREYYNIYAGAFYARMQIDPYNDHDLDHSKSKDGIYMSLFPAAWSGYVDGVTKPILEINSVVSFCAYEKGYLVLNAEFDTFWNMPAADVIGEDQCKLVMELQVGDWYWDAQAGHWTNIKTQFYPSNANAKKFPNNWNKNMNIERVDGICIPTYELNPFGEITIRIYPETYRYNGSEGTQWREMCCGVFFHNLTLEYRQKKNYDRNNRKNNTYLNILNANFASEISIENDLASYLHNDPSSSLLYENLGYFTSKPMELLTYVNSLGITFYKRPEVNLLQRLSSYYGYPRSIINLIVKNIDDKPLPLLRYKGLGDGKVYIPMSASKDFQKETSTIRFFELPAEPT